MSGDGIYGFFNGGTIRNNYSHDVDGNGITFEGNPESTKSPMEVGNYLAEGNLIERCGQGIWLHYGSYAQKSVGSVRVENNMVLYTGYGYNHGCLCVEVGISVGDLPEEGWLDGVYVRDNIVYVSRMVLFDTFDYGANSLHLQGNRYFVK